MSTATLNFTRAQREMTLVREFAAPSELVFASLTEPERLARWLSGPDEWQLIDCQSDAHVGGSYRFVWRNALSEQLTIRGEYLEIEPPSRLVFTQRVERDDLAYDAIITLSLSDRSGRARLEQTFRWISPRAVAGARRIS